MARSVDIDFECWFCGLAFIRADVEDDGSLVPRVNSKGGPYLLYICPGCDKKSRVERNRPGAFLAGPTPIVPVADTIISAFDADLREELRKKRAFEKRRKGRREWFFDTYAQELWAAGVRPQNVSERKRPGPGARKERPKQQRPPPPPEPKPKAKANPPPPPEPEPELEFELVDDEPQAPTPWEILGVERDATPEELTKAFRELAKRYHPDKFDALDDDFRELAHKKFLQIKQAYDHLSES